MSDTQKAFKLSQLAPITTSELDGNDLFLVSDSTTTNNEKFVSKKLTYKDLKSEVTKLVVEDAKLTNAKIKLILTDLAARVKSVDVKQKLTDGEEIAEITVDGKAKKLYAPKGGTGSGVTEEQVKDIILNFKKKLPISDDSMPNAGIFSWNGTNSLNEGKTELMLWNNVVLMTLNYENYDRYLDSWTTITTIPITKEGKTEELEVAIKLKADFNEANKEWQFTPMFYDSECKDFYFALTPFAGYDHTYSNEETGGYGEIRFYAKTESALMTEDGELAKYSIYLSDYASTIINVAKDIINGLSEVRNKYDSRKYVRNEEHWLVDGGCAYVFSSKWDHANLEKGLELDKQPNYDESQKVWIWNGLYDDGTTQYKVICTANAALDADYAVFNGEITIAGKPKTITFDAKHINEKKYTSEFNFNDNTPYYSEDDKCWYLNAYKFIDKEKVEVKFISNDDKDTYDLHFYYVNEPEQITYYADSLYRRSKSVELDEQYITDKQVKILDAISTIDLAHLTFTNLTIDSDNCEIYLPNLIDMQEKYQDKYAFSATVRCNNIFKEAVQIHLNGYNVAYESFTENPLLIKVNIPTYLVFTWIGDKWLIEHKEIFN